ncbi:MAG: hypothetical protein COB36_12090 [Alphaproteobacteria bacterium]|nr:MAG: hypothetical protein COB36_12090 [Alphaproteobacteria bacterium]
MKLDMIKGPGGALSPASDEVADKMSKFSTGDIYPVEIKRARNPRFHGKVFKFFEFCLGHWSAEKTHWENMDSASQGESFRKQLTIQAGYFTQTYSLDGTGFVIEAKSLSFGNMEQEEFEACYSALINAAIKTVFAGTTDEVILNRLQGFF